jgi:hypothetical protein
MTVWLAASNFHDRVFFIRIKNWFTVLKIFHSNEDVTVAGEVQ